MILSRVFFSLTFLLYACHLFSAPATGPLTIHASNPRYFDNGSGKAVYLTGSHTWNNFIDMDSISPPDSFNYSAYLDFLDSNNHNFIRLWAWELPKAASARYPRRQYASPMPWLRTGPGTDVTGEPRFDLTKWNPEYFSRLRQHVKVARDRGIYVSVMLFEGWGAQFAPGKDSHPFNQQNNINGIHYGSSPSNVHALTVSAITALQEAYVQMVIDSVNDLDNVLYEIVNESGAYSTAWQYHFIDFVRAYEAQKPKQHPIGMTVQYQNGSNTTLFNSTADWISPNKDGGYQDNPPAADGSKIIITDNDHQGGSAWGNPVWVWKSFTRGFHVIFMDRYGYPDGVTNDLISGTKEIRRAMGQTLVYANRMNLAAMTPQNSTASTGYCLANFSLDNAEYLVYLPSGGSVTVDLTTMPVALSVEWFNPSDGSTIDSGKVTGGSNLDFTAPFSGHAVLYLSRKD